MVSIRVIFANRPIHGRSFVDDSTHFLGGIMSVSEPPGARGTLHFGRPPRIATSPRGHGHSLRGTSVARSPIRGGFCDKRHRMTRRREL